MIVAGVGCRRGTPPEEIAEAIERALTAFGLTGGQPDLIATEAGKAEEPGVADAARRMGVGLVACAVDEMRAVSHRALTVSARVAAIKGVPSVAETAALVAAGRDSRLLGPRVATANATCAIAVGEGR
jgi:cobalt-precorrin 5A hydrolase